MSQSRGRPSTVRIALASAMFVGAIALLPGSSSASSGAHYTTVPNRSRSSFGVVPGSIAKKKNVNVSKKAGPQSETAVAVDPTNAKHLLAASNDLSGSGTTHMYESTNGGKKWKLVNTGITGFCYDPWLHFNDKGDAFFAHECSDQRYGYRLHGTNNWVLTTFTAGQAGGFPDRDMIVTDDTSTSSFYGSAYIGYDDANASNAAYILYSRNGKNGWTRSPKINDAGGTIGVNVSVAPDGTIYASWLDWAAKKLMVDKSTDGGATWGTDHLIHTMVLNTSGFFTLIPPTPHRGIVPFPFTKASPVGTAHAGRLYVTYEDRPSGGPTDTNAYVTYSDNGGTSWSTPALVNDDRGTAYQFFPAIAVAPNGNVGLSWYDTRNDGTNKKTDQYFSFSSDGGDTWSSNKKLTTAQSDETGANDQNDYGDYEGLDAGPTNRFAAVWTDSRPGNLNEDLYFAKVKAV